MKYLTLASNVRNNFDLYAAHLLIEDKQTFILIQHLNESSVIFVCPKIKICVNKYSLLRFNSSFGYIEMNIKIKSISNNQYMFSIEGTVAGINKMDFLIALNNFLLKAIDKKRRTEERILCTTNNLRRLQLINTFFLTYKKKRYKCIIKDISASGIKFITSSDLMNHINEKFDIQIKFYNPDVVFCFNNCFVIRKNEILINGKSYAETVLCLNQINNNLKYIERLNEYYAIKKINIR